VACAAALAVLDEIEENELLAHANALGEYFVAQLRGLASPLIAEVRGLGLMIGLELVGDFKEHLGLEDARPPALALTTRLMDAGLLVIPAGERTIRFLPPLNVAPPEIDAAIAILRASLNPA